MSSSVQLNSIFSFFLIIILVSLSSSSSSSSSSVRGDDHLRFSHRQSLDQNQNQEPLIRSASSTDDEELPASLYKRLFFQVHPSSSLSTQSTRGPDGQMNNLATSRRSDYGHNADYLNHYYHHFNQAENESNRPHVHTHNVQRLNQQVINNNNNQRRYTNVFGLTKRRGEINKFILDGLSKYRTTERPSTTSLSRPSSSHYLSSAFEKPFSGEDEYTDRLLQDIESSKSESFKLFTNSANYKPRSSYKLFSTGHKSKFIIKDDDDEIGDDEIGDGEEYKDTDGGHGSSGRRRSEVKPSASEAKFHANRFDWNGFDLKKSAKLSNINNYYSKKMQLRSLNGFH